LVLLIRLVLRLILLILPVRLLVLQMIRKMFPVEPVISLLEMSL
jgi:hypothetical protein